LCGHLGPVEPGRRDGNAPCQLLTEYGFTESLVGAGDGRWDDRKRRRDTPDVVLVGDDWLVAVEAKVFSRPTQAELELQFRAQRVLIDEWRDILGIPDDRVHHVALIPEQLAALVGQLSVRTVTWQQVADAYRIVGPAYWVGIIDVACERWENLVSSQAPFTANAEATLTGKQILEASEAGLLEYGYMGRRGGLEGPLLKEDIKSGRWRDHSDEVRGEELPDNKNWLSIPSFVAMLSARSP